MAYEKNKSLILQYLSYQNKKSFAKKLLLNQYKLMLSSLEHVSSIELGFLSRCFYFLCLLFIVVYNCMVYSVEDYR